MVCNRSVIGFGLGHVCGSGLGLNCVREHTVAGKMKHVRGYEYRDFNMFICITFATQPSFLYAGSR